ncbi:hypothetical protein MNV49_000212 [Pseudohyphozyma bogoriensis]|nr:hypothetical protein MNV49_000212 [Pseudohyphozyma bogoriensis]
MAPRRRASAPQTQWDPSSASESDESEYEEEQDQENYEVESVLDHKRAEDGKLEYLVSWVGYDDVSDQSWEPEAHLASRCTETSGHVLERATAESNGGAVRWRETAAGQAAAREAAKVRRCECEYGWEKEEERPGSSPFKAAPKQSRPAARTYGNKKKGVATGRPTREVGSVELSEQEEMASGEGVPSWEGLIKKIDTIERVRVGEGAGRDEGDLRLFVIWNSDDSYSWISNRMGRERCPQKVIDFYESHLTFV